MKHPITNSVRYIGKTNNYKTRLSNHISLAKRFKGSRYICNWINSLLNKDLKPIFEVIEECEDNWIEREKYWIKYYKDLGCKLCNLTDGGEGICGLPRSFYNKYSKLTKEQVLEIRDLLIKGYNTKFIADKFKVSKLTVNDIKLGKTWRNLGPFLIKGKLNKILPEEIEKIKELIKLGYSQRKIQEITGISRMTITLIKNGKR